MIALALTLVASAIALATISGAPPRDRTPPAPGPVERWARRAGRATARRWRAPR